jgi:uncharacterized protein (DUF2141 family)
MIRTQAIRAAIRLLIATTSFFTIPVYAGELEVTVRGVESEAGQLMIAIVNSEAAFNGETPAVLSLLIAPKPGTLSFSTDALPDGDYGIRVMHDENGNGDMDANMVGMPTEPWGFSNNAMGNFGPPAWSDIRFSLAGEAAVAIDLNH